MKAHQLKKHSKFLSLVLRHRPELIGIELDKHGWTDVNDLLEKAATKGVTIDFEKLKTIVEKNDKKRFSFSSDNKKIRANQGHSVPVELEYEKKTPPHTLFHCTDKSNLQSIMLHGLYKGKRHDVHLSDTEKQALKVRSKHKTPILLSIKAAEMHKQGFDFYLTVNKVWLTARVPPEFIVFTQ